MNIFGNAEPKKSPDELVKEWRRNIAKESRAIERDIDKLKVAEKKTALECKKYAKDGRSDAARILAKEIVNTRKTMERMHAAKTQLNSVSMQLQTSASILKMQGCFAKSTEILQTMNELMNLPELRATMNTMSREMMRSGLIDEAINDALESVEPAGIDSAADAEVDRVMTELTASILAPAGHAPTGLKKAAAASAVEEQVVEDDTDLQEMNSRLASL